MACRLAAGHYYTAMAVLDLPCASAWNQQQQQQQQQGDRQHQSAADGTDLHGNSTTTNKRSSSSSSGRVYGTKPFLVLASYLLLPPTTSSAAAGTSSQQEQQQQKQQKLLQHGTEVRQGLLSVFDLTKTISGSNSSGSGRNGTREASGTGPVAMGSDRVHTNASLAADSYWERQGGEVGGGHGGQSSSKAKVLYKLQLMGTYTLPPGYMGTCLAVAKPRWEGPGGDATAAVGAVGADSAVAAVESEAVAMEIDGCGSDVVAGGSGSSSSSKRYKSGSSGSTCVTWTQRLDGGVVASLPLLLVGGEAGLTAYHVWVDDTGAAGRNAVQEALQAVQKVGGVVGVAYVRGNVGCRKGAQGPQVVGGVCAEVFGVGGGPQGAS